MAGNKPEPKGREVGEPENFNTAREHKRINLYSRLILVGIVVLIIMQGYMILSNEPYVIITSGSVFTLPPGGANSQSFSTSRYSMLSGGFNASGPAILIISTLSQGKTPNPRCPSCYVYSAVSFGLPEIFSEGLGPGSYWLTFMGGNQSAATIIIITQSVIVTPL